MDSTQAPILVVDDDPKVRNALSLLLVRSGYAVDVAASGEEALERATAPVRPALLLLDLAMPGIGGEEALRRWRAHERLRDVPVVLCTALPAQQLACISADGYLPKPVAASRLLAVVADLVGRRATGS